MSSQTNHTTHATEQTDNPHFSSEEKRSHKNNSSSEDLVPKHTLPTAPFTDITKRPFWLFIYGITALVAVVVIVLKLDGEILYKDKNREVLIRPSQDKIESIPEHKATESN